MTIEASGGDAANTQTTTTRYDNIETVSALEAPKEEILSEQPQEKPVAETPVEPVDDDGQSDDDAQVEEKPKKRNGFKEKLERERARVAELEAKLAEKDKPAPEKPVVTEGKPKPEDFESWEAYYEKLADWKIDQRDKEREKKSRDEKRQSEITDKQKQYAEAADEFKATQPDFDEVIDSYDGPLTQEMSQALLDAGKMGPRIAYYLAQNPDEAEALSKMTVLAMNKAIGRIEAKLEGSPTQESKPAPKTTKAPPPITPVGKSAVTSAYNPYDAKGKDDHEEFMKWRQNRK